MIDSGDGEILTYFGTAAFLNGVANDGNDIARVSAGVANDSNDIARMSAEVANDGSDIAGVMLEATTKSTSASPPVRKPKKRSSPKPKASKEPRAPKVPKAPKAKALKVPKAPKAPKVPKASKAPKRATARKAPPKDGQKHRMTDSSQQNSFTWSTAAFVSSLQGFETAAPSDAAGNAFSAQGLQPMPIPITLGMAFPLQSFQHPSPPMPFPQVATQTMQPFQIKTLPEPPQQILWQERQPYGSIDDPIDLTSEESTEEDTISPRPILVEYSDNPPIKYDNLWDTEYGTDVWWEWWKDEEPKLPKEYRDAYQQESVEVPRVWEEVNGNVIWTLLDE
ncbi:MAG: hypothetical protein LQ342_006045 [Letrouitia transgressa]|nr:MAG: hypothetical protein LQ342_006045 [Letrouitia transgressa]